MPPNNLSDSDIYESGYSESLYYATLIIMGSDVLPVTTLETFFVCIVLVSGSLFTNTIFASMTLLVDSINENTDAFDNDSDIASDVMAILKLPKLL